MKEEKNYQSQAISQLVNFSKVYFETDNNETIIFQAPTGAGKTFMITRYISKIIDETNLELCFLWVSIGNANLQVQSYKSVKKEISPLIQCSLLEKEYFGYKDQISKNEIVFLNWEKIRTKDKDTGAFTNSVMTDKDSVNFIEVLKNTRLNNKKIILIIDESHKSANTERAMELRDEIIKPFLTIEMSATPVLTNDMSVRIQIDPSKVIEEHMIKKEVIINNDILNIDDDETYSDNLILKSAYEKRNELASLYRLEKSNVNPLVLIQLPNGVLGDEKKEMVIDFLKDKHITTDNGKLAIWLTEEKVNKEEDLLSMNDNQVEYLIFKTAIDTGWDCPRAQILLKFRETSSISFEIQTVGRILRMPETKHYLDEKLNRAYVYTNIQSIIIKKEIYNPNIIKSLLSTRKNCYSPIPLKSYYRNRIDFGDITSEFSMFFERAFSRYFNIDYKDIELPNYDECLDKLRKKGIIFDDYKLDSLITNAEIDSKNIDKGVKLENNNYINLRVSKNDLEAKYNTILLKILNGFSPSRSLSRVKTAIIGTFKKYLYIKPSNGGIESVQVIIVKNADVFSTILSAAIDDYKTYHKKDLENKNKGITNNNWEIAPSKNYNPQVNKKIESTLSLYQPLYLPCNNNEVDQLELEFINYLDDNKSSIDWFWKNGDEHMQTNFGIKKDDGYTFQPDFIVKFKNGEIGVFDTKAIGHNENDNYSKSDALYSYITEERYNGKKIIGGLVVKSKNKFYIYQKARYQSYNDNPELWNEFDQFFI